jgi:hypothetical protein
MNLLYESDTFAVTHLATDQAWDTPTTTGLNAEPANAMNTAHKPTLVRHGFEIVDKRSGKEVYLDGSWAELFQEKLQAWQRQSPTQEEVEDTLDSYAGLAQMPVTIH